MTVDQDIRELIDVHNTIVEMKNAKIQHLVMFLEHSLGLIYMMRQEGCFDRYDDDFVAKVDGMLHNIMKVIEMEKSNESTLQ